MYKILSVLIDSVELEVILLFINYNDESVEAIIHVLEESDRVATARVPYRYQLHSIRYDDGLAMKIMDIQMISITSTFGIVVQVCSPYNVLIHFYMNDRFNDTMID